MYRHRGSSAIDMDLGCAVLNGEVGYISCKYYMGGACNILDIDKIVHNNYFSLSTIKFLIKYTNS